MAAESVVERVKLADWSVAQTPGVIRPEEGPGLLELLDQEDPEVRELAICCLDEAGGASARRGILRGLRDPVENVRSASCRFLRDHVQAEDLPALLEILDASSDEFVRERVALAVGRTDAPAAAEPLRSQLKKETDPDAERALRLALARLADPTERQAYLERLRAEDPAERARALRDLPYLADPSLIPAVLPLLSDVRDAENVAPAGHQAFIRVCDVAVQALDQLLDHPFPFEVSFTRRYEESELITAETTAKNRTR